MPQSSSPNLWNPDHPRYSRDVAQRRLLALDGGGVRGVLTLRILRKIEAMVCDGNKYARLSDYFHYIGGTSTGAIIASGLARGMKVDEIEGYYHDLAEKIFDPVPWYKKLKYLYDDGAVSTALREVFGEKTTFLPKDLETLLLVVTQNVTTDSPWPISSNVQAKYNDRKREDCNLKLPLWKVVRASTAAPIYFPPEVVKVGEQRFVFVDGGTTPYNNPAFLLFRMATTPEYRLRWRTGEDKLLVVSLGTGFRTSAGPVADDANQNILNATKRTISQLMNQAAVEQDVLCRSFGRCVYGAAIDSELGTMMPDDDEPRAFRYMRYDADIQSWTDKQADLAAVASIPALVEAGDKAAKEVKAEHFEGFLA
jgi:uncharacterized protein